MDLLKEKFLTTFKSYIIDNKLNFGYPQEGYKINKSILHLKDSSGKIIHIDNIKNINIEKLIFEPEVSLEFDFNAVKNYVREVLSSDKELATYILGLSKFGDKISLLKEFSKNEDYFLKILGQTNIYQSESLKLKQLNMVFNILDQYSSNYENELKSFIKVNRGVFKNPELLSRLINFLDNHSNLDKQYFVTLLKVKNQDLFLDSENHTYSLRIDKTQLYGTIDFNIPVNKDNYWKMLKNIEKFYNSKESKPKGIEYAIIDNYSNEHTYFRLTLETNEKNILDKKEIESLTYELFANFAASVISSNKKSISDKLYTEQSKQYQKIFDMFILNKKIPHKVPISQKFKI